LGSDLDDGRISRSEGTLRRGWIERRLAAERSALRELPTSADLAAIPTTATGFRTMWDTASVRRQRALVRALTDQIRVLHHVGGRLPFYDPERVVVTWRA
jgi:hypothetical protein